MEIRNAEKYINCLIETMCNNGIISKPKDAGKLFSNNKLYKNEDGEIVGWMISAKEIEIIAVSFPYKQEFNIKDKNDENKKVIPQTSKKKVRERLFDNNIELVQGTMPFSEIIIPGTREIKKSTIVNTLSLISRGLSFCVQSVLMATDAGVVEKGKDVIAMSADTAVVANSANSQWLFHPVEGLEIKEIICKAHKIS